MNQLHTLIALATITLVGCGAKDRAEISIFVTEPESGTSYKTTMLIENGKRIFFPSTYQCLGEVCVKFGVHYHPDETLAIQVEAKRGDVIESKGLKLLICDTSAHTFESGTIVTVETRNPN